MFINVWERYFFWEMTKIFFLFLLSFYGLYALLDYSSHSASFHKGHVRFDLIQIIQYYTFEFIARLDVLIPFAVLISTIKTLCSLNVNRELVALMAGGIKLTRILRPFLIVGLFCTALIYLNTETILPYAAKQLRRIHDVRSMQKVKQHYKPAVKHLPLEDGSTLLFHHYDGATQEFHDTYWVRSIDEIYKMKFLSTNQTVPSGHYIDYLKRDADGNLIVQASYQEKKLPDLHFNPEALKESVIPSEELSFSDLHKKLPKEPKVLNEKEAAAITAFYYKMAMPWLSLLAVMGPAPFCVRFSRTLSIFMIYACSIFGLVAFYIIMNAAMILGERQVFEPVWAIGLPFSGFMLLFGWRFCLLK